MENETERQAERCGDEEDQKWPFWDGVDTIRQRFDESYQFQEIMIQASPHSCYLFFEFMKQNFLHFEC